VYEHDQPEDKSQDANRSEENYQSILSHGTGCPFTVQFPVEVTAGTPDELTVCANAAPYPARTRIATIPKETNAVRWLILIL
jgi:hypothetical protein